MKIEILRDMLLTMYSSGDTSELTRDTIRRDAKKMVTVCAEDSISDEVIGIVADSIAWRVVTVV